MLRTYAALPLRLVALLMVMCLIADPALAHGATPSSSMRQGSDLSTQAFAVRSRAVAHEFTALITAWQHRLTTDVWRNAELQWPLGASAVFFMAVGWLTAPDLTDWFRSWAVTTPVSSLSEMDGLFRRANPIGSMPFLNGLTLSFLSAFSIAGHELAHAVQAEREGDLTPRVNNQRSWNLARYTSPLGAFVSLLGLMMGIPLIVFFTRISPRFGHPDQRYALARVALAGPAASLFFAILLQLLGMTFAGSADQGITAGLIAQLKIAAQFNFILVALNLLPFSFLDGQKVLRAFTGTRLRAFDTFSQGLGVFLLLGYLVWSSVSGSNVTALATSTDTQNLYDLFAWGLFLPLILLCFYIFIPSIDRVARFIGGKLGHRTVLSDGGYKIEILNPVQRLGFLNTENSNIELAIPWRSGRAHPSFAGQVFRYYPESPTVSPREVVELTNGRSSPLHSETLPNIKFGHFIALAKADDPQYETLYLLPAELWEGPTNAKYWRESQLLASALRFGGQPNEFWDREERDIVIALWRKVGLPIYGIESWDEAPHSILWLVQDASGAPNVFIQRFIISGILGLRAPNQKRVLTLLGKYAQAIREGIEQAGSVEGAHEGFMRESEGFIRWTQRVRQKASHRLFNRPPPTNPPPSERATLSAA